MAPAHPSAALSDEDFELAVLRIVEGGSLSEASLVQVREHVAALKAERDNADRIAGSVTRRLAYYQTRANRNDEWLAARKRELGVHYNAPFDVAWDRLIAVRDAVIPIKDEADHYADADEMFIVRIPVRVGELRKIRDAMQLVATKK